MEVLSLLSKLLLMYFQSFVPDHFATILVKLVIQVTVEN